MNKRAIRPDLALLALFVICSAGLVFLPIGSGKQVLAFLTLWVWPALSWMRLLTGEKSMRFVLAAGLALLLNGLVILLLNFLPGAIDFWQVLVGASIVFLIPIIVSLFLPEQSVPIKGKAQSHWMMLGAILLIALFLRLPNLGHKELQGDEGIIMVRAASLLTGDKAELFLHQKGPIEILVPSSTWALTGAVNDYWIRSPFTWAGILSVLAIYWLGRIWFAPNVGIVSAALYAVGGFGIAFSRIVQYQSFVVLWGTLSLLSASRFRERGLLIDLILSIGFLAAGLLAHYDTILFAPAVAWILVSGVVSRGKFDWRSWFLALFIGGIILAPFYVPYMNNPSFGRTLSYLLDVRVGVGQDEATLAWGGGDAWRMATFYNSIWYIIMLILMSAIGIWSIIKGKKSLAPVLFFVVPAIFYLVIVKDPRTHVYTIIPGACILSGLGIIHFWQRILWTKNKYLYGASIIGALIWFVIVALYPFLMFVDVWPERQRTWDLNRPYPILYPVTWDKPPLYGLFGFPHQAGWRAVWNFILEEALPYASNEEEEITNWYMAQASRTYCPNMNTLIIANNTQDAVPYDTEWIKELHLQRQITVNGNTTMKIYSRQPVTSVESVEAPSTNRWLTPGEVIPARFTGQIPVNVELEESIRLLGYDLDTTNAQPGGSLIVTLYWEALRPIYRNKQVFIHLYDGILWAQHDGAPECNINPTSRWEPGQIVPDTHIVSLPEDIPYGSIPLLVGMYDLITGERMAILNNADDSIYLQDVLIGPD